MRVLALTRYASLGASSRLRILQYRNRLAEDGIELVEAPFFNDDYIRAMYRGNRDILSVAAAFSRRVKTLIGQRAPDAIWLEKEALPWIPWFVEKAFLPQSVPLIVDYDDAVFHRYDSHDFSAVRFMYGRKIDAIMARADIVVVGNRYLADRAKKAGAKDVEIIPTVVNHQRYLEAMESAGGQVRIGWIGSPNTAKYLNFVAPVFRQLASSSPIEFHAIGARQDQLPDQNMKAVPWSEASEVAELGQLMVGIMPLPDEPWERGKCGYKLIQYMACGLPVVASPVGVNSEIVLHGKTGFLARTESEWMDALKRLICNRPLRNSMGAAGRALVESKYSVDVQLPRLETLLRRALE